MNLYKRLISTILFAFKSKKYKTYKPKKEGRKPQYKGHCELCNKKAVFPDYFYCKYCNKYHCDNHRLPEQHKCSGNPTIPIDMR